MRIISKFKDYYDTALSHGEDDSIIFKRFTECKTIEHKQSAPLDIHIPHIYKDDWFVGYSNPFFAFHTQVFIIAFCGKLYYGVRLFYIEHYQVNTGMLHYRASFYSKESLDKFLVSKGAKPKESDRFYRRNTLLIEDHFRGSTLPHSGLIDSKISIALWAEPEVQFHDQRRIFVLNPCLKDFDFAKVIDPHTAFQELSMYLGGVLTSEGNKTVQIDDKYRIPQHGFDKWSFRKLPQSNPKPNKGLKS